MISQYGSQIYAIFFLIIFCETGLVLTPFLPGDSLLFTAGAFAALGQLNIWFMFAILSVAAVLGDTVNYWIGHYLGPKVFKWEKSRLFNPEHLKRTHNFYEKYGAKTIILARLVPIVRTFAPFVAGIGAIGCRNLESGFHPNLTESIGYGTIAAASALVFASAVYVMFREIYRESWQR